MENKYKAHYHMNEDGSAEVLCELLDCFEQPCYFQYKKVSDRNPWIFFCGNINLTFCVRDKITLGTVICKTRGQYGNIHTISFTNEYYKNISNLLNVYGEVILTTAFNYVNDYVWFKDEGKNGIHTQHCTYLLGENDKDYYIADNPYVLLEPAKIELESNNSVFVIPKSHFQEAFEKCCIVTTLKYQNLPKTKESELAYFMAICKEIGTDYIEKDSVKGVFLGRQALLLLKSELENGNEHMMDDFFVYHIVIARRIVFKRCINLFKEYIFESSHVSSLLKQSIEQWKIIKELAFEYHYHNKKVCLSAAKKMKEIIEIEDALINEIINIPWKTII